MTAAIAVDLTSLRPRWSDPAGVIRDIFPSFCLGWLPGEPALVGDLAREHRRGRVPAARGCESYLDLNNRSRYHWAEGWLRMMGRPDSPEPAGVRMTWCPGGRQEVRTGFVDAIWELVSEFRRVTGARRLGLVVPGGLGTGAQEEIITALERGDRFEEVQLFPRPIAVGIAWARSHPGGGGKLLVTTACADFWEADVVELRKSPDGMLCPVQDRTGLTSEFRCIGLEMAFARQADEAEEWRQRLLEPGAPGVVAAPSRSLNIVNLAAIPESCSLVMDEARKLHKEGGLLEHMHVGLLQSGILPAAFACPADLPRPQLDVDQDTVLNGVIEGMKRLAAGKVPYFEALAPVYLKVDRRNKYLDPVTEWRLLTEQEPQVVPAGSEYVSAAPLTGFALPAGQRKLPLYLRVHRSRKVEFRLMDSDLEEQEQSTPVHISLRMRPGRGQARVAVESAESGVFGVELRERELTRVAEAVADGREYAWPIGSAIVLQRPDVDDVTSALQRIVQEAEMAGFVNPDNIKLISSLFRPHHAPERGLTALELGVPEDIYFPFVRIGKISSGREFPLRREHEDLLERLAPYLVSTVNDYEEGSDGEVVAAVTASGWLYSRCPEPILATVRNRIQAPTPAACYVNCAGRAFEKVSDISFFYSLFCIRISEGNASLQWWRAARNIMQMRVDALRAEALGGNYLQVILGEFIHVLEETLDDNPSSPYVGECLRIACHILKRRRFQPDYLSPEDPFYNRLHSVLVAACNGAGVASWRVLAHAAQELLARKGTLSTLKAIGDDLVGDEAG